MASRMDRYNESKNNITRSAKHQNMYNSISSSNYLNYENMENGKIEKCISSNTGTYVIMELENSEQEIDLIYDNKIYKGKKRLLGVYNNGKYELLYQFNITIDDKQRHRFFFNYGKG